MNVHVPQPKGREVPKGWMREAETPDIEAEELTAWGLARAELRDLAITQGWSNNVAANHCDVAESTLHQWFGGKYKGAYSKVTAKVGKFCQTWHTMNGVVVGLPTDPGFVETRIARQAMAAMSWCQAKGKMATITLSSGLGKTMAAEAYAERSGHVYMMTLSPYVRTPPQVLAELAALLGVRAATRQRLVREIGERLASHGTRALIIVDEAQQATDQTIHQLRHFRDVYGCGIVILGNEAVHERLSPSAAVDDLQAQTQRRIGMRVHLTKPYPEDVTALIDAWGINDTEVRELLAEIAQRPGALGAMCETLEAAFPLAADAGGTVTIADLRAAYEMRGETPRRRAA